MNAQIAQISARIRELRDILGISREDAAAKVGITPEVYDSYENGQADIPVGVLYSLANAVFGVDPTVLLTGDVPRMDDYTIVRRGHGVKVERHPGYSFSALAFNYKNRDMNPMVVTIDKSEVAELICHAGQEFNFVLEGTIKVVIGKHEFTLDEGDSIYFNAVVAHGQRAVSEVARFLTVINE